MKKNKVLTSVLGLLIKGIILVAGALIIYNIGIYAYKTGYDFMSRPSTDNMAVKDVQITIPKGASTKQIASILKDNNLIHNVYYFLLNAKLSGMDGQFKYGDYVLNTGMDDDALMRTLITEGAKKDTKTFVIPEGYTMEQIADKLSSEGFCTKDEFKDAVNNVAYGYTFIEQIPDRDSKLQGYLFPDTYEFYTDSTAQEIVSRMLAKFDEVFTQEYYERAEDLGYSVDEIITIASIIEREVRVKEERTLVSSVIYNRLKDNINLCMCSTVMYMLDKDRERLLYSDLEIDSPYNTYKNPGLPIGPIANPGQHSIYAALYPEDTDYRYFVLKDSATGEHEFNTTLEAHNAAKNKYKQDF